MQVAGSETRHKACTTNAFLIGLPVIVCPIGCLITYLYFCKLLASLVNAALETTANVRLLSALSDRALSVFNCAIQITLLVDRELILLTTVFGAWRNMVYRLVVRVRLSLFTLQKVGRLTTPSRQFARTTHYNKESYKLVVVGGGTGGCATAARFCRRLGKGNVAVIEPSEVGGTQSFSDKT